ncbi:MAG: MBOAT family protein [Lachnospiraceae bacterium]|nr:MBOAT family protein [Lachnospiraceae bacterium]
MVFSSLSFIFVFLPVFLALYYILPAKCRNLLLFFGSLVFYSFGEPYYLFLILCSITVNFIIGRGLEHFEGRHFERKTLLILSLIYNFGFLLFFKYTNFFIENINAALRLVRIPWRFYTLSITLPLGISFYTFQIASYVIDVYLGKTKADKSYISLGAYLCMFPQLIAGPIVVYSDIRDALKSRTVSVYGLDNGFKTFIVGLGYKVIIANRIGTLWNEVCTIGFESISTPLAWLGAFAYAMQLYFDFCGYSLMAVGLGEMLGFHMPANFEHPYTARSVTDFWRRWHITLGAWFREYVYIPLGGNRRGKKRMLFNLLVVWFLTGFWHGAAWNFILWGLFIFILQIIEKNITLKWLNADNIFAKLTSHVYMIFYILVSWSIFAISDFRELGVFLSRLFPFFVSGSADSQMLFNLSDFTRLALDYAPLLIASILFATDYPERLFEKIRNRFFGVALAFVIFWWSVYYLGIGMNNPFLYFRY